jgi:membrane associated rhomboid family serine protease
MVAGIIHMVMTLNMDLPTVGASGAVWALIGMFFLTHTEERMSFLFIPINMKVKHLVAILFVIEVVLAINSISTTDGLAHWAHIGGCIFGYLYYKLNNKTQS